MLIMGATILLSVLLLLLSTVSVSIQQPPGVPPRQQPPHGQPPQHHHQQPAQQQQQQTPQYQQQQQQQHQQQQQQQQVEGQGHGHGHSGESQHGHHGKSLEFASEIHNRDHILEHLQTMVSTKPKEQLTPEELEFHYFKLHDFDNNNQLDGWELVNAVTHVHIDPNNTASNTKENIPVLSDEELANTVDGILNTFDHDKNGYVEYFEFKKVSQGGA